MVINVPASETGGSGGLVEVDENGIEEEGREPSSMELAYNAMVETREKITLAIQAEGGSRELSLALTNFEQSMLWFKQHGNRGYWTS